MAIEASAGARVGDYVLVRKIGEGGMAEVWLARHGVTAQLRALKFLNSQFQGIPEVEARFQNEGENQLIHPNIVRIFEVGQQGGSSFIAMEYVDGHDLENILNSRRGPLTIAESIDIGTQILAGLGFAHSNGIIHRDIKPSNVLVDQEGRAYVMDFGIAKVARAGRVLTQVNSRLGTPDYMSPEQIKNPRDVDTRSDIYSFGCLFCELLTGWPPFDRGEGYETEHDIKTAHVTLPPTPPSVRKPGLPEQLNAITLKCLAKAKEDRPQTCDEVIAAFNAYRISTMKKQPSRSNTVVEPPPPPMPRPGPGTGSGTGPGMTPPYGGRPTPNPAPPFGPTSGPSPVQRPGTEGGPHNTGAGVHGRTPTVVEPGQPGQYPNQSPGQFPGQYSGQYSGQPGSRPSQPGFPPQYPQQYPPQAQPAGPPLAQGPAQPPFQHPVLPPLPPPGQGPGVQPGYPPANPPAYSPFAAPAQYRQATKMDSGAFPQMFAIAAISLFALVALGGSGWAYYQKSHADDRNPATTNTSTSGTEQTAAQPNSQTANQQTANQSTPVPPPAQQPVQQPSYSQTGTNQASPSQPAVKPQITQQEIDNSSFAPVKPRPRPSMSTMTVPTSATSGTLVWTGDASSQPRQVITIVRSNGSVMGGGRLTGTMFPASPVEVSLYPSTGAVVFAPDAKTNYNSMQLFLTAPGAQTIYIHWKVKPSS